MEPGDEDLGYVVLVRITGCGSRPYPIEEGVQKALEADGYEVYQAIIDAGYGALIPIDRRDWILPETSEGRSAF